VCLVGIGAEVSSQAQIPKLDDTVLAHKGVLRLHISVHNAMPVHMVQRIADLKEDAPNLVLFEHPVAMSGFA